VEGKVRLEEGSGEKGEVELDEMRVRSNRS